MPYSALLIATPLVMSVAKIYEMCWWYKPGQNETVGQKERQGENRGI